MSRIQKSVAKWFGAFLLSFCSFSYSNAQIQIPGTDFTLTPVNNGTGGLVSVPIPGGSGLSVTVGTGSAAIPLQDIRNNPNAVNNKDFLSVTAIIRFRLRTEFRLPI